MIRSTHSRFFSGLFLLAVFLVAAWPAGAQSAHGTLVYRKVFKDSSPEFVEIRLEPSGSGTSDIRQLDDDPEPQPLEVSPELVAKIYSLAAELDYFKGVELDVRRRIANLGQKTFRYEGGSAANEVTFNYTLNSSATQLMQIFEGLARQQEHLETLTRRLRFDRLGINDALIRFEVDLNRKLIPEPERLLPVLEEVANDSRVIEMSRTRARAIIQRIRNSRPS